MSVVIGGLQLLLFLYSEWVVKENIQLDLQETSAVQIAHVSDAGTKTYSLIHYQPLQLQGVLVYYHLQGPELSLNQMCVY